MLDKEAVTTLVSRLSIELGYTEVDASLFDDIPRTVEDYANSILQAEGFTPGVAGDYYRDVRRVVSEVFERYCVANN